MQHRTIVTGLAAALALSAFTIPATARADESYGDIQITEVVANGGKNIVLGTRDVKKFTISVTAVDDSGIQVGDTFPSMWNGLVPWEGTYLYHGFVMPDDIAGKCVDESFTTTTCTYKLEMDPRVDPQDNTTAGTWKVSAHSEANDGDYIGKDAAAKAKVLRNSKLKVNASPEPVKKNKAITVTGALTRANWKTFKYGGYTDQPVKLQYRKKGTGTYKTLKTVRTDSRGNLKTTTKATADGYYRYSFAGTYTTAAETSTPDYVDVT
ncbi:calcium-binding protein [Streptomyces phytophilus]|uniref:calcium-binding protein n=1 Tax=Streptomyces phytophilus TaxID=722715 RepID=UPI0015F0E599|nr:calcium-binding protein [Streptomyces phytophilus]